MRYLGEVLGEEHPGHQRLPRSDADLVVETFAVSSTVWREDQRLGDLGAGQPACEERGDLTLAGLAPKASKRTVAERAALARSITIATRPSESEPGRDAWSVTQLSTAGTVTTLAPPCAAWGAL